MTWLDYLLTTRWPLFQSFSIVKFASGPYASTLIFKLRLKVLSTQKSTKGKGGPRGLNEPGLQKETIIYYISYIFFVFMVVEAQCQEFTFFKIFLVCELSIIYISFFVSPFLPINWGKNIFISAYSVRKTFFFCVILRKIFFMSVWSNVLFNQKDYTHNVAGFTNEYQGLISPFQYQTLLAKNR